MIDIAKFYLLGLAKTFFLLLLAKIFAPAFAYDYVLVVLGFSWAYFSQSWDFSTRPRFGLGFLLVALFPVWQAVNYAFIKKGGIYVNHPYNLGDYPFHQHLSAYLQKASFWPKNPIYASEDLLYAFASNLLHASFLDLPISSTSAFSLLTCIYTLVSLLLVYQMGGLKFVLIVFYSASLFVLSDDVYWKGLYLANFLTQKGYLYALPFGLLWIYRLTLYLQDGSEFKKKELLLYLFLFGTLGFFHYHAFFVLGLISLVVFLLKPSKTLFLLLFGAFLLACYFPVNASLHSDFKAYFSFVEQNLWEWLKNFLPFLFMLAVLVIRDRSQRKLVFSLSLLFFVFQFVVLAPWKWDNVKIILWPYLFLCFLFLRSQRITNLTKWVFVLLLTFAGVLQMLRDTMNAQPQKIWDISELQRIEKRLPNNLEVFWIEPTYNHPLFYFGYPVVMGYTGHLWSHGIHYQDKFNRIRASFVDKESVLKEMQKEGAAYMIYTSIESASSYKKVYQDLGLDKDQLLLPLQGR